MPYRNRRVTVMGLGHFGGGVGVARWLARQGAKVTVTDLADAKALRKPLKELESEPIAHYALGGHREEDFCLADVLVVNPAVKPEHPLVDLARRSGAEITSELELSLRACPATVVGVTGSNGKSTTAGMIAAIVQAAGRRCYLGGNLGGSLLDHASDMRRGDVAVLEISSFQLWWLSAQAPAVHVAVVTSFTPNHLDWHGTLDHYRAAKQRIFQRQTDRDWAVLNRFDSEVASWRALVRARLAAEIAVQQLPPLHVPGVHNRVNAACAASAAIALGLDGRAVIRGLSEFRGLPQRLEPVAAVDGRQFYNDTAATTPESTIAALGALEGRVWLMAGGRDKGFDFAALAQAIARQAAGAAFYGASAKRLLAEVQKHTPQFTGVALETLDQALGWCWRASRPGESIVLSPACASTDQFVNFKQRGEVFVKLVQRYAKGARP